MKLSGMLYPKRLKKQLQQKTARAMKKLVKSLPRFLRKQIVRQQIRIDDRYLDKVVFKVAQSREELEAAYRLVHDAYVLEGYMDPNESGMRDSVYNSVPGTATFIGLHEGKVILTVSIFADSPEVGLPMDSLYKKELDELRAQGRKIVEVGTLASHPDYRNKNQNIVMHCNKIMLLYAYSQQVDDLVITVNPKHVWVYEDLFVFNRIGELKLYDYVNDNPAIPLRRNLHTMKADLQRVFGHKKNSRNLFHFFFLLDSPCIQLPPAEKPHEKPHTASPAKIRKKAA